MVLRMRGHAMAGPCRPNRCSAQAGPTGAPALNLNGCGPADGNSVGLERPDGEVDDWRSMVVGRAQPGIPVASRPRVAGDPAPRCRPNWRRMVLGPARTAPHPPS